jgi:hypothetical protein
MTMNHVVRIASLTATLVAFSGTAFADDTEPPPRTGLEGGFGLYGGSIRCHNETNTNVCDGVSSAGGIDLHLNYFFNPKLGIFGDVFPMVHDEDNVTLTHTVVSAGLKWRPAPILTFGAGLGSAQARWKFKGILNGVEAETDTVAALFLSAGIELVRGKSFALDLQARAGIGFYKEDENNNGEADIQGKNIGIGGSLTLF